MAWASRAVQVRIRVLTGTFRVLHALLTGWDAKVAVEAGTLSVSAGSAGAMASLGQFESPI
jgi:hypothetical protein